MKVYKNKLIVVLGMHRSGTSVMARGLKVLGVELGDNLLPPGEDNPKGYWEEQDINALNVELLNFLNTDWHFLTPIQTEDVSLLRKHGYLEKAVNLLREKTNDIPIFGFKDPRLAKLLPFWKEVFTVGQLKPYYILTIRHPLSVCKSLTKRNGFSSEKGYILWLEHIINSLTHTAGESRIVVDYDRLMQFPENEITRIAEEFQLQIDPEEFERFKFEFLDTELRHTIYELKDLSFDKSAPPLVQEIYSKLLDVSANDLQMEDVLFINRLKQWGNTYYQMEVSLKFADQLEKKINIANQLLYERDAQIQLLNGVVAEKDTTIQSIYQSKSWRVTYPLRWFTDRLRNIRDKIDFLVDFITLSNIKKIIKYFIHCDFFTIQQRIASKYKLYLARQQENEQSLTNLDSFQDYFLLPSTHFRCETSFIPEIDIIIPIFNGMEFLPKLFESIFTNTKTPYRIICVDDCSTDPTVRPFLESIVAEHKNILLLHNEKNEGFVKTVNLASTYANNHFVILNTDIEVPDGWLQRLMKPILDNLTIASTTPFSNAATIFSFPEPLVDNPIFADLDVNSVDSVFRLVNPDAVTIDVPTGVGFCMGINQEAWKKIGSFNSELFGRGYGEENDWCMRAISAGYRNMFVPNLFVYHKHGGSFLSDEKQKLLQANLDKVARLHPNYLPWVERFIKTDPPKILRDFASIILMVRASSNNTVLIVDHEIGGGANSYRNQTIKERLQDGYVTLLMTYDPVRLGLKLQAKFGGYAINFSLQDFKNFQYLQKYIQINEIYYNNLVSYESPLEIIQTLVELKKIFSARLTVLFHDYYPICPSYTLLNDSGSYCGIPSIDQCRKCLPKNSYRASNELIDIDSWRNVWGKFVNDADQVICFSNSSEQLVLRAYDIDRKKISIRPHKPLHEFEKKPKINFHAPLSIGIVGAINYAKGAKMVVDVANYFFKLDPNVKLTVIGSMSIKPQSPNITILGPYDISKLPDIIEQYKINICFFPSVWPETFSYVVSEVIEMELPICAFNLGAPAERLYDYPLGHLIEKIDAEVVVKEILEFHARLLVKNKL